MTFPRLHLFESPMTRIAHYGLLILWALCFASCRNEPASNIPDVSDIHVDIDLPRFDQLLFQDTTIDAARIHKLRDDTRPYGCLF
jgi:hypothetical protein